MEVSSPDVFEENLLADMLVQASSYYVIWKIYYG